MCRISQVSDARKKIRRCLVVLSVLSVGFTASAQLDLLTDDTNGDGIELTLEDQPKLSQGEFEEQLDNALAEPASGPRRKQLLGLLDAMVSSDRIVLGKQAANRFIGEVGSVASETDLRPYVPKLLQVDDDLQFDLPAQARLQIGTRLALLAGGAFFEQLAGILRQHGGLTDLEWLLPALGRAGGSAALPLLQTYRNDAAIIPLGNDQNIRRIPCAAVLACAYAGDDQALETILEWYEQDVQNLPRFAWYVQWAKQEGHDPANSQRLLDYTRHRLRQAERLLDYRGADLLPKLIQQATSELSVSLAKYLAAKVQSETQSELPLFLPLLKHPSLAVKGEVLNALLTRGNRQLRQNATEMVRSLTQSESGLDRFFAVQQMLHGTVPADAGVIADAVHREPNPEVQRRMQMLTAK